MKKLIFICLILTTSSLYAKSSILGGGVTPWTQFPNADTDIKGVRINAGWGYHGSVYGLDIGFANTTDKAMAGIQMGFINTNFGQSLFTLTQLGLINYNHGKMYGFGIQAGFLNINVKDGNWYGVQLSVANFGKNKIRGLQLGAYNEAESVSGLQIGIINKTNNLKGIQIGLLNIATGSGGLPFSPILNIGF
jgi:hypothetical protein